MRTTVLSGYPNADHGRTSDIVEAFFAAVTEEINRRTDSRVAAEIPADLEWPIYVQREDRIYWAERVAVLAAQRITEEDFAAWEVEGEHGPLAELRDGDVTKAGR
ncbi:hypothetical protein [Saccharopolyspora pogona]|uniref:hypothetical protein n=1 Tax=Saccharopolyspora pogona TaxID=333966 RepID=UPI001687179C|nr:hypothetical protein [Saccharopolyspora pogona]